MWIEAYAMVERETGKILCYRNAREDVERLLSNPIAALTCCLVVLRGRIDE